MTFIPSKTSFALVLIASTALSGCATTIGTTLSTPFGYVKDHPAPEGISNYDTVKEWAYGVSDGYSSRGTMNRYSLYWGGALAAGGAGALGGLAATGSTGHASIIIPLAATFIGTVFGYYHNEEQAQVYYSASDSINTLISKSEKRRNLIDKENLINQLKETIDKDLSGATDTLKALTITKTNIPDNAKLLGNLDADTLAALGKMVDATNAKIDEAQGKIDLAIKRKHNLSLLLNDPPKSSDGKISSPDTPIVRDSKAPYYEAYEAGCLNEDIEDIIHRVHNHLTLLDPQHVSDDLKNVKTPASNNSSNTPPPVTNPSSTFDLSDLDPKKIVSSCDIGL